MPPGINRTYKIGRGRMYKSQEAAVWQREAFYLIKQERNQKRLWKTKVSIIMYGRAHKKWDIDMGIKIILDTLTYAGLFEDDSEIDELIVYKKFGEDKPSIQVML